MMKSFRQVFILVFVLVFIVIGISVQSVYAAQQDASLMFAGECVPSGTTCITTGGTTVRLQASGAMVGIVQFDVSTAGSWAIDTSRLNLAAGYTGVCTLPNVPVSIYSTTGNTGASFDRGVLLASLDAGNAVVPYPGSHALSAAYHHWSDTGGGGALSTYLETERLNDGIATLWIETSGSFVGSMMFEGTSALDGACGTGQGGVYSIGAPVLQMADDTPATGPLAINLISAETATGDHNNALWITGTLLLGILTTGLILVRRQRHTG